MFDEDDPLSSLPPSSASSSPSNLPPTSKTATSQSQPLSTSPVPTTLALLRTHRSSRSTSPRPQMLSLALLALGALAALPSGTDALSYHSNNPRNLIHRRQHEHNHKRSLGHEAKMGGRMHRRVKRGDAGTFSCSLSTGARLSCCLFGSGGRGRDEKNGCCGRAKATRSVHRPSFSFKQAMEYVGGPVRRVDTLWRGRRSSGRKTKRHSPSQALSRANRGVSSSSRLRRSSSLLPSTATDLRQRR
jgi:hypothetical protein